LVVEEMRDGQGRWDVEEEDIGEVNPMHRFEEEDAVVEGIHHLDGGPR
jgi:hypothetical protein